jgi:tripartite-type tricarboxylate transporter receptor subunit TctC
MSLVLTGGLIVSMPAIAQEYPTRPIRLIVGFPPGGAGDILGRVAAHNLTTALGQQVIVDNRGGAGGAIASELAARAVPDGYTLHSCSNPCVVNPSLRKVSYHPVKDFAPISQVGWGAQLLVVNPAMPFRTIPELVSFAKAQPGKLSFGSAGSGASGHLAMELFKFTTGIDLLHVPYKGTGLVINDLIAGQVQMTMGSAVPLLPQVKAGKMRALAVTSSRRIGVAPDIPTIAESGYPDYEVVQWFFIVAPAGTPRNIVMRLNAAIVKSLAQPEVRERYAAQSVEAAASTPEALGKLIATEYAKWAAVIKRLNLKAD